MMRKLLGMAALISALLAANAAHAENFVLVLAAKPNAGAKAELTELVQAVYRKIGPGDLVIAYDATHERIFARVEVPNRPSIGTNRNLKASLINSQFGKVWDFLDAGAEGEAGDVAPARFLTTDLPRIMDEMPGRTAQVILTGSAVYNDAREPSFSMNGGYVPTDAHLALGQDQSPYGVAGRDKALQGATVHICYTDAAEAWTTDIFRQRVGRLWALETTLQGGRFGMFGPLDAGCVDSFLNGKIASATFTVDRSDTKPTMRKYERTTTRPVEARAGEAPSAAAATPPASAEALFQQPPCTTAPATLTGPLRIGIKWDCPSCDLDLYARSRPQAEWLYYHHRLPADGNGFFDHDFTSPPPGGDAYEYIQFNTADLREVSAKVDFYGGSMPGGPPFRLRVWFAGCAYDAPALRIAAATGNAGRPEPATNWKTVDVLAVVGLRSQVSNATAR